MADSTFDSIDTQLRKKDARINALTDALRHLLEVQVVPSCDYHDEWLHACNDGRRVLREKS